MTSLERRTLYVNQSYTCKMMLSYSFHYSYLSVKQFLSSVNRSALLGFDESKNDLLQSERMEATN